MCVYVCVLFSELLGSVVCCLLLISKLNGYFSLKIFSSPVIFLYLFEISITHVSYHLIFFPSSWILWFVWILIFFHHFSHLIFFSMILLTCLQVHWFFPWLCQVFDEPIKNIFHFCYYVFKFCHFHLILFFYSSIFLFELLIWCCIFVYLIRAFSKLIVVILNSLSDDLNIHILSESGSVFCLLIGLWYVSWHFACFLIIFVESQTSHIV